MAAVSLMIVIAAARWPADHGGSEVGRWSWIMAIITMAAGLAADAETGSNLTLNTSCHGSTVGSCIPRQQSWWLIIGLSEREQQIQF
jgi:hypothetical protein